MPTLRSSPPPPPAVPTLNLTVRFATPPLPDLPLPLPATTTIHTLKQHLRTHLPPAWNRHGIRLISAGRLLSDPDRLSTAFPHALSSTSSTPQIYIHCALTTDPLSAASLAASETPTPAATTTDSALPTSAAPSHQALPTTPAPTPAPPQGFDRLRATAGFTAADITSLRTQFRASIAARHTPTTMPSPTTLLLMEERWLDGGTLAEAGTEGAVAPGSEEEEDAARALDDTLFGVLSGFFWPVGAVVWGLREEGVWSRRRGWSVLAGVVLNLGFGVVRVMG